LSVIALDHLPEIAADAKALLDANRARVNQFLDSREDLVAVRPEAGTIVFPRLAHGHADAFCQLLRQKYETAVVPGHFFEMPEFFRLGYSVDAETLENGLERMASALDEFSRAH
ncbi:MAG: aminotransferase class I/II-fold pyridoxal phosphate-dependent enzyme, partial [Candidatus Acidiferrales bacterium]